MTPPTCCLCKTPLGDEECCERYAHLRVQACGDCGRTLVGQSYAAWIATLGTAERSTLPPLVAGFLHDAVQDRPLCPSCFAGHTKTKCEG